MEVQQIRSQESERKDGCIEVGHIGNSECRRDGDACWLVYQGSWNAEHPMWGQTKNELEQISPSEEQRYAEQGAQRFVKGAGSSEYKFKKRSVIRK